MSSRAENWAWERDDVKGITKFVLVYLARRAYYDDGAAAWPSVETIAFNCGCCERTVIRSLQELERKGYISGERVFGCSSAASMPMRSNSARAVSSHSRHVRSCRACLTAMFQFLPPAASASRS